MEPATTGALRYAVRAAMPRARADLADLVAIRSVADPSVEPVSECRRAAEAVQRLLTEVGVGDVHAVETSDGSLAVLGHTPGPPGAPTVLLYSHYDVQPAGDEREWLTPPWELTEVDERWYGRGAADCKGNLVMHLTALRALGQPFPVGVRVVCEGSEEQSSGGLEALVRSNPEAFAAEVVLVADAGNVELGVPSVTTSLRGTGSVLVTVRTMERPAHSGMFGGAAPDALQALVHMLATLRDTDGETTVRGLAAGQRWSGAAYPRERFRAEAAVLPGVRVLGREEVGDAVWARPAATVLAIDAPSVEGAGAAVQPVSRALVNLRVPPGTDAVHAQDLLIAHLEQVAPWGAHVEVKRVSLGQPFRARTDGPAFAALGRAMGEAFGRPMVSTGQGGSIPLCPALAEVLPDAEILVIGVEEPSCRIHAPGESVDPAELERTALAEALLLQDLGATSPARASGS